MNGRIRALYYECQDESLSTEQCYQKFAQLLIQECIDQIGDYTTDIQVGTEYNTSLQKEVPVFRIVDAETTLRKYFGVEE